MSAYVLRLDYWHYSIVREVAVTPGVKYGVLSSEVRYLSGMFFFYHDLSVQVNLDFLYDVPQSHSVKHPTLGRTLLDERPPIHRERCLTTHITDKRHACQ